MEMEASGGTMLNRQQVAINSHMQHKNSAEEESPSFSVMALFSLSLGIKPRHGVVLLYLSLGRKAFSMQMKEKKNLLKLQRKRSGPD